MNLNPTVANSYFVDIGNNFTSWEFNSTSAWILGVVLGCILILVVGNYIFSLVQRQRSSSGESIFNISNANEILATLNLAFRHRSKFELKLSRESSEIAVCSLFQILADSIILELPADIHPTPNWVEKQVYIFFNVPLDKDHKSYYFFTSRIKEILNTDSEFRQLRISIPTILQQKQKRSHLRYEPASDQIEEFIVWNAKDTSTPEPLYKIDYLNNNYIRIEQNKSELHCPILLNISGGGLMFSIPKQFIRDHGFEQEKTKHLYIYLHLPDPYENTSTSIYLFARIKNTIPDISGKRLQFGVQYLYMGTYTYDDPTLLQWEEVDPAAGVEAISNWVFKQHLKLYREKGIA
ncbi:MAG: PilZ domain-containing protein [Thermodesulfobacteriota bacterium]